jgi:hypothetical protein
MNASRLTQVKPRLIKLLLMLSSQHPGEVTNAARQIERTLREVGADWHDLTRELTSAPPPPPPPPPEPDINDDWCAMRDYCLRHLHRLSAREQGLIETLDHWRGDYITEKQMAWLQSIYARLRRQSEARK